MRQVHELDVVDDFPLHADSFKDLLLRDHDAKQPDGAHAAEQNQAREAQALRAALDSFLRKATHPALFIRRCYPSYVFFFLFFVDFFYFF